MWEQFFRYFLDMRWSALGSGLFYLFMLGIVGTIVAMVVVRKRWSFTESIQHVNTIALALFPAIPIALYFEHLGRNVVGQGALAFVGLAYIIFPYCFVHAFMTMFLASFIWKRTEQQ